MAKVIIFTDINMCFGFARDCGAYKIATELRRAGFDTQVVDFFAEMTTDEVADVVSRFVTKDTLLVAFATTHFVKELPDEELINVKSQRHLRELFVATNLFPKSDEAMDVILRDIKSKNPNTKIAVGGERVSYCLKDSPLIDFYITGKGDVSIVALADSLDGGTRELKGHKLPVGGFQINSNIDYKYYSFINSKVIWAPEDHIFQGECLPIEISRSCAFNCRYCGFDKKDSDEYIKDMDVLRDELLRNYDQFGTTEYMICDPTLNDTIGKVRSLHKLFTSLPFKIEWSAFLRLDLINKYPEETRDLLGESGARSVEFGIESFNEKSLKIIGKPLHPSRTKELLYFLKEGWGDQVVMGSGFIVGLPEESEESVFESFEWLRSDDCPLDGALFTPLFIAKHVPSLEHIEDFPLFTKDPGKYGISGGYKETKGTKRFHLDWSHKYMNNSRAVDLASYFAHHVVNKPIFHFFHHMRNVGYTDDECKNMKLTFPDKFMESKFRKKQLKNRYLKSLLDSPERSSTEKSKVSV